MDEQLVAQFAAKVTTWDEGAWCLAALALCTADAGSDESIRGAAREVLIAAGVDDPTTAGPFPAAQLNGIASAPLLQAVGLIDGHRGWSDHDDATLRAQGQASGTAAAMFVHFGLPQLGDLGDRLAAPGARMLDVGVGIGALAIGYAREFPNLHVTGLDVMPRVLAAARENVAASLVADRIELREQDVATMTDVDAYDLAWLPAPFVPESALRPGVGRIAAALRPGGVVMVGHGRFDGSPLQNALTRLKTVAYGGTPLDGAAAVALLTEHGLADARTVPSPPGAPAITVGRRRD